MFLVNIEQGLYGLWIKGVKFLNDFLLYSKPIYWIIFLKNQRIKRNHKLSQKSAFDQPRKWINQHEGHFCLILMTNIWTCLCSEKTLWIKKSYFWSNFKIVIGFLKIKVSFIKPSNQRKSTSIQESFIVYTNIMMN